MTSNNEVDEYFFRVCKALAEVVKAPVAMPGVFYVTVAEDGTVDAGGAVLHDNIPLQAAIDAVKTALDDAASRMTKSGA